MSLRPLPKRGLRSPVSEEAIGRIWRVLETRSGSSGAPRVRRWGVVSLAVVVALALVIVGVERRDRGPLRFADGRPLAAVEAPVSMGAVLAMSDGSRIDLGEGARLTPLESTGSTFVAALERGTAHFEVRPGGPRRWQVECGLATVEVVGTGFDCRLGPGRLRVSVDHGAVLVRGEQVPDRARRLAAGESLDIVTSTPAQPRETSLPAPDHGQVAPPAAEHPSATPEKAASGAWVQLARGGDHRRAFATLGEQGIRRETRRLGVSDLLLLADVARLSGHAIEAVPPLDRILREFPRDPQAPLAAFALGRLNLDDLDRPAKAAIALSRALDLGVPRSLREDVRTRLVEAYARAGNRAAARTAADAYVREFPQGSNLSIVQSQLR